MKIIIKANYLRLNIVLPPLILNRLSWL